MVRIVEKRLVGRLDICGVAFGLEDPGADLLFVDAQFHDRVFKIAGHRERPELHALRLNFRDIRRRRFGGRGNRDRRHCEVAVDVHNKGVVSDFGFFDLAVQRRQFDALAVGGSVGLGGEFRGARGDSVVEFRARDDFVDQIPVGCALATDAFGRGAEKIGPVMAHLALVNQTGQTAGARQHRQQGQFGQRHGGGTVVDQHDVIAGQRQFVTTAGTGAVDGRQKTDTRIVVGVLDPIAGLVGEFAEIDLVGVRRLGQHPDVGAGAEYPVLVRRQDHRPHLRMFETNALQCVVEFDIDAEVVGIQFQLVAGEQRGVFVHI